MPRKISMNNGGNLFLLHTLLYTQFRATRIIDRASSTPNDIQVCSSFDAHVTHVFTAIIRLHVVLLRLSLYTRRDIAVSPWILRSDWDTCARVWISKRVPQQTFNGRVSRPNLIHEILPRFEIYRMDAATDTYNFPEMDKVTLKRILDRKERIHYYILITFIDKFPFFFY